MSRAENHQWSYSLGIPTRFLAAIDQILLAIVLIVFIQHRTDSTHGQRIETIYLIGDPSAEYLS